MRKFLTSSKMVEIKVYGTCKYEKDSEVVCKTSYDDIEGFDIFDLNSKQGREIDRELYREFEPDTYHEYLVLYHTDGNTSTYRNSYVDMFHI